MKKFLALLLVASFCFGCNPSQLGTANQVLTVVETVVSVATAIFGDAKPLIPAADQATAEAKFTQLILNVEQAKSTLQAALNLAADATTKPDVGKLTDDVIAAVNDLETFIDTFKSTAVGVDQKSPHEIFETSKTILARSKS
jgi:hypothetical protein